ncbi:tRNA 2-thiouridine(34) synthase MnmA [Desulfogranum japonicum]|uniref:tRNA 2-thiouridine(34) synthase MnmA n=1 Tax=Desulfogranum japonicum TaxID=231447 RepID=UPI000418C208|nr:tRNA 2-thiouridine(34) synthase MnmA [Desulfogranum japonicum]
MSLEHQVASGQTIGVAMSGGVDSTVTAALLMENGYKVHGFFMLLPLDSLEQQHEKVSHVAEQLQIPLTCVDIRDSFQEIVIRHFTGLYKQGLTPNPCVHCNRHIKFGLLMQTIQEHGIALMSTGHYARIRQNKTVAQLWRGKDPQKDQSYFLCRLTPGQLKHLVLPLGNYVKDDTYRKAHELGFDFSGQESQDVCFLQENLTDFLASHGICPVQGDIVTTSGKCIGVHTGIWNYTVGQRRGLGIPDATPWYVVALDARHNQVIVGKNEQLMLNTLIVRDTQWHMTPPLQWEGDVQIRSRHRAAAAELHRLSDQRYQIRFDTPQRAVTPGQYAVFYEADHLVGSGIIEQQSVVEV